MRVAVALAFVVAFLVGSPVLAADANLPHEHRGKIKPYPRPPKPLVVSAAEQAVLQAGKPVMRTIEGEGGGRGLAVFIVNAPADLTWSTIQDFKSYPKWIPEVKVAEVYKKDGGKIDVHFQISSFPVTMDYFIHHDYDLANRWGTWTLDFDRLSDLDDSMGFWRVTPVEGHPDQSQVEYSIDVALKGWVPSFIRSILVDNGLKQATTWVKVQSEKRFQAQPKQPAPAVVSP